jgi:acyl-CoA dehydrogenase
VLHRAVAEPRRGLGREELGARDLGGGALAAVHGGRGLADEQLGGPQAHVHLGDVEAQTLEGGERASAEVARAKLFATEAASWLCDRAVQHLGGLGVKRGSPVERAWREARALRIYEGTTEVQKLILARELLEGPAED